MDTSGVMDLALRMAGMAQIPGDSGIWNPGKNVKRALFSIDAGTAEILLAQRLGYDLLIAHHPVGPARLTFADVVGRHVEFMTEKGVPRSVAESATAEIVDKIRVRSHPSNYLHEVDVARLVGMPFMNIHLPIDQITRDILLSRIRGSGAKSVADLVDCLGEMPEFKNAQTDIEVRMGEPGSRLGKWVLVFAAGTNGGYPVAKAYFEHGVDTVIYLHIDNEELVRLRKDCKGNLVVLGHMAGDSVGANEFLAALEKKGVASDTIGIVKP